MRVLARFGAAPFCLLIFLASSAAVPVKSKEAAPTVPPLSQSSRGMIEASDAIVFGRVGSMTAGTLDGDPVRFAVFEVSEAIKGGLTGTIELVLPGGTVSGPSFVAESVDNTVPTFSADEEVVVFLTRVPQRERGYAVSAGLVGRITVRRSPEGEAWVTHLLDSRGSAPLARLREQIQKGLQGSSTSQQTP